MTVVNRRTLLTVGGVSVATLLAGLPGGAALAEDVPADFPVPASGGTPPGPYLYGFGADDILDYDLENARWAQHLRCPIPRAKRIAPFAATQAHPDLDPATQLSTLTTEDAGSVYEGHMQPIGLEAQTYTQRYWAYIDIWGTWHGQVKGPEPLEIIDGERVKRTYGVIDIPNPGWTEAAHKNGARSIGSWFWPRSEDQWAPFFVTRDDGSFPVADKLIELREFFGFDGLFINQEASVSADQIVVFQDFWRYVKRQDPDFYLHSYDSADYDSGYVSYENRLSSDNLRWLGTDEEPLFDSIFINYAWPYVDKDLSKSRAAAIEAGYEPREVGFAGVEHQKGGFRPEEDFGSVAGPGSTSPTSVALFVDTQRWLEASVQGITSTVSGRATYRRDEQLFWAGPTGNPTTSGRLEARRPPYRTDVLNYRQWDGIAHWITERSPYSSLPITHDFNIGVGSGFWSEGLKVRDTGWDNMGCADTSLTWQYWTEGGLTAALDETISWGSGHSLSLTGSGTIHLFKTDLTSQKVIKASIRSTGLTSVKLGVTWKDAPESIEWVSATRRRGDWDRWRTSFHAMGRRIARISLRTSGTGHLGNITLSGPDIMPAVKAVRGVTVETVGPAADGCQHLEFHWDPSDRAVSYDIYQNGGSVMTWLGRVSRTVFFAESVDLSKGRTFRVVPVGADGGFGPHSEVRL